MEFVASQTSKNHRFWKRLCPFLFGFAASLGSLSTVSAQTLAYSIGSSTENLLDFRPGSAAGTVNANVPGLAVAIAYNNIAATGAGSGWNLSATGGAAIGLAVV